MNKTYIFLTLIVILIPLIIFYQELVILAFYDKNTKNTVRNFCMECKDKDIKRKEHFCDKYYAKKHFSENDYEYLKTTKLMKRITDPENLKLDNLPDRFIAKSTYGSKNNLIVTDEESKKEFLKNIKTWLTDKRNYEDEPQYNFSLNSVIVEELIDIDYEIKAIVIKGKIAFYYSVTNGFVYFDHNKEEIKDLPYTTWYKNKFKRKMKNKDLLIWKIRKNLDKIEKDLNKFYENTKFDFYRFDIFVTKDNQLYFGEVTFTPNKCGLKLPSLEYHKKLYNDFVK